MTVKAAAYIFPNSVNSGTFAPCAQEKQWYLHSGHSETVHLMETYVFSDNSGEGKNGIQLPKELGGGLYGLNITWTVSAAWKSTMEYDSHQF